VSLYEGTERNGFSMKVSITEANVTPGQTNRSISSARGPWQSCRGIRGPAVSTRLRDGLTGTCLGVNTIDRLSQDFGHCPGREEANADVTEQASV